MIVYKNFLRIVLTRKIMVIMYSCIFLLTSFIFSSNGRTTVSEFKETSLTLNIIDKDNSELSKNLIQYLKTKNKVIETTSLQNLNEDEIIRKIKKEISLEEIDAGIIINNNLEDKLLEGTDCITCLKDERNTSSLYIDMQIQKFLLFANAVKSAENKFNFEKIHRALEESIQVVKVPSKTNTGAGSWFKLFFNMFAWFSFSIILNVVGWAIFLLEKPMIKIRNDISPVSTLRFSIENFAAQLTVVFCFLFAVIGAAVLLNLKNISGIPLPIYSLNCVIYAAVILSMTFMLNAILKQGSVLGIVGTVLPLALAFISGVFMPAEFISPSILRIAKFFPTFYFVQANEFTYSFFKIDWRNIGMLVLFFVLYFSAGFYFNARKRSQNKIDAEQK